MTVAQYAILWLVVVNALTYGAFAADKDRAIRGAWRISEQSLLLLALAGVWVGAKLAQGRFRHKTRKQPFATLLNLVPLVWIGVGLALTYPAVRLMLTGG